MDSWILGVWVQGRGLNWRSKYLGVIGTKMKLCTWVRSPEEGLLIEM